MATITIENMRSLAPMPEGERKTKLTQALADCGKRDNGHCYRAPTEHHSNGGRPFQRNWIDENTYIWYTNRG